MGRFEDRLREGMRDPDFAHGYAEARQEVAALRYAASLMRSSLVVSTFTTGTAVRVSAPSYVELGQLALAVGASR